MKETKNRKRRGFLILLLLFIPISLAILSALAMSASSAVRQAELDAALEKSRLERSVLIMADKQRNQIRLKAEADKAMQEAERRQLEADFLRREKETLLMLVNPWNPLPEDYEPQLVFLGDGIYMDERAAGPLTKMLQACLADGYMSVPISGFRTQEYQQELYDNKVERLLRDGWPEDRVYEEAAKSVAVPGTSEHQLGLAMDILDVNNPNLDITQEWTNAQRWLMKHCTEYGFILRYPNGSTDITGIIYEPWHYRYVGKATAAAVSASGQVFEEYLQKED